MTYEPAHLNWYSAGPDYYGSSRKAPTPAGGNAAAAGDAAPANQRSPTATQTAARHPESEHVTKHGDSHDTAPGNFTFDDLIDIINPLHHIPVVGMVYRSLTGDTISAHAQILGGGLWGGGSGFVGAIANAISEEVSGRDIASNLVAAVFEDAGSAGSDNVATLVTPQQLAQGDPYYPPATSRGTGRPPAVPPAEDLAALPEGKAVTIPVPPAPSEPAPTAAAAPAVAAPTTPAAGVSGPEEVASRTLSGRDALNALAADLRGGGRSTGRSGAPTNRADAPATPRSGPAPRPAPPRQPGPVIGARPTAAQQPGSSATAVDKSPAGFVGVPGLGGLDSTLFASVQQQAQAEVPAVRAAGSAAPVPAGFSEQMLRGLEKYQALAADRQAGSLVPAASLEREL